MTVNPPVKVIRLDTMHYQINRTFETICLGTTKSAPETGLIYILKRYRSKRIFLAYSSTGTVEFKTMGLASHSCVSVEQASSLNDFTIGPGISWLDNKKLGKSCPVEWNAIHFLTYRWPHLSMLCSMRTVPSSYTTGSVNRSVFVILSFADVLIGIPGIFSSCWTGHECHGIYEHHCGSYAALHVIYLPKWKWQLCTIEHSMSYDSNYARLVPGT